MEPKTPLFAAGLWYRSIYLSLVNDDYLVLRARASTRLTVPTTIQYAPKTRARPFRGSRLERSRARAERPISFKSNVG